MGALFPLLTIFVIRLSPGMAFQSVAVAGPVMLSRTGLSHAQLGLALGAFTFPGLIVSVPAGMLARRIGNSAVLLGGLLLIALGSALAGATNAYPVLIAGRVLAGAGGMSVLMLTVKMTADRYLGPWLSTASAVALTAWPAGLAVGLLLFGPTPAAFGWRATIGLAGLPALVAILLLPLIRRAPPPTSAEARAAAAAPRPPRSFTVGAIVTWCLINGVLTTLIGFLPSYLVARGASVSGAAAATSLAMWSPALCIPLGGLLADRLVGRRLAVAGGLAATAALLLIIAGGGTSGLALIGFGVAFSAAPGPLTAQLGQTTPASSRAVVFGWYSACSYMAMTLGPWLAGWLRDLTGDPGAPLLFAASLCVTALVPYAVMNRALATHERTFMVPDRTG